MTASMKLTRITSPVALCTSLCASLCPVASAAQKMEMRPTARWLLLKMEKSTATTLGTTVNRTNSPDLVCSKFFGFQMDVSREHILYN